jgi:quinol monooxygenase YgiN
MYTIIERRTANQPRVEEALALAQTEFFPALQAADGFVGFYLVPDGDLFTAILVWEDKAKADAFDATYKAWTKKLDEFGHKVESENHGDTVVALEPQR